MIFFYANLDAVRFYNKFAPSLSQSHKWLEKDRLTNRFILLSPRLWIITSIWLIIVWVVDPLISLNFVKLNGQLIESNSYNLSPEMLIHAHWSLTFVTDP